MTSIRSLFTVLVFALLVSAVFAETPDTYRFPRICTTTADGYPVPLCGKPLTTTPLVKRVTTTNPAKKYPKYFQPGEALAARGNALNGNRHREPPASTGDKQEQAG